MIVIGEKINATRKAVVAALAERDARHIIQLVDEQVAAGADYLDLNGGAPRQEEELKNMQWLVELVQEHTDVPLCIDSADADAAEVGLTAAAGKPILNSISLESERLERFLPIIRRHECMVVGLCISDDGMPTSAADRLARAEKLIAKLTGAGKQVDEIIVDPCFMPVSAQPDSARVVCEAITEIRRRFAEVHVGGGLCNVSFGLPKRKFVNMAMLAEAVCCGMDVAIIDPCTPTLTALLRASEVISGADEWCANYMAAYREGKLE